jgi:hypothetical protein
VEITGQIAGMTRWGVQLAKKLIEGSADEGGRFAVGFGYLALKRNGISCECRLPRLQRSPYLLCKEIPSHQSKRETRQLFGEAGLDTEKGYGNPPEKVLLMSRLDPSASELNLIEVRLT